MKKPDATLLLDELIKQKEEERTIATAQLRQQLSDTIEELKPVNQLKKALLPGEMKTDLVDTSIGALAGFLARKAMVRTSANPLLKLAGTIAGIGVAQFVSKHPAGIRAIGSSIFSRLFTKKSGNK